MRNFLNRSLVAGIFCCLPALGLVGCNRSRQLGFIASSQIFNGPVHNPIFCDAYGQAKDKDHASNPEHSTAGPAMQAVGVATNVTSTRSITDISADIAGGIGGLGMGGLGGMIGAGVGAIGGGVYAACNHKPIVKGVVDGASGGAHYVSSIAAPIGKYTFCMTTRGVIWATPHVFNGIWWIAAKACRGIWYLWTRNASEGLIEAAIVEADSDHEDAESQSFYSARSDSDHEDADSQSFYSARSDNDHEDAGSRVPLEEVTCPKRIA